MGGCCYSIYPSRGKVTRNDEYVTQTIGFEAEKVKSVILKEESPWISADPGPQVTAIAVKDSLKEREETWKKLVGRSKVVTTFSMSSKSLEIAASWVPRPTDVVIATPPKTGTTWLQQLIHQLRTGGDMEFEDIYQPIPWQIMAYDLGIDINAEQPSYKKVTNNDFFFPRVYKSHQRLSACHPGAQFIVTIRDPATVWSSKYRFMQSWKSPKIKNFSGMNDLGFFSLIEDMSFGASLYEYYLEFWKLRDQENVLIVCFEDLMKETERYIPLIANFIGLDHPTEELIAEVLRMSTREFMTNHINVFDESWVHKKLIEIGRHKNPEEFLPCQRVGKSEPVNEEVKEFLREKWEEKMKETDFKTYSEFRDEIRKVTEERFAVLSQNLIFHNNL